MSLNLYLRELKGNGNSLQYSCLENPMDRGVWWATVHGVAKSRPGLSDWAQTIGHLLWCGSVCKEVFFVLKFFPNQLLIKYIYLTYHPSVSKLSFLFCKVILLDFHFVIFHLVKHLVWCLKMMCAFYFQEMVGQSVICLCITVTSNEMSCKMKDMDDW